MLPPYSETVEHEPQGRKLLDRQPIVNNVADDRLDPRRDILSLQCHPGMGGGKDPEDFVREPLAQGFHPRKIQKDLAKPIQPGKEPSRFGPGDVRAGIESYQDLAALEPEVEVLGSEGAEHLFQLPPRRAAHGKRDLRAPEGCADVDEYVPPPVIHHELQPVRPERKRIARFGGEEDPFPGVTFRQGCRFSLQELSDCPILSIELVVARDGREDAHALITDPDTKLTLG